MYVIKLKGLGRRSYLNAGLWDDSKRGAVVLRNKASAKKLVNNCEYEYKLEKVLPDVRIRGELLELALYMGACYSAISYLNRKKIRTFKDFLNHCTNPNFIVWALDMLEIDIFEGDPYYDKNFFKKNEYNFEKWINRAKEVLNEYREGTRSTHCVLRRRPTISQRRNRGRLARS